MITQSKQNSVISYIQCINNYSIWFFSVTLILHTDLTRPLPLYTKGQLDQSDGCEKVWHNFSGGRAESNAAGTSFAWPNILYFHYTLYKGRSTLAICCVGLLFFWSSTNSELNFQSKIRNLLLKILDLPLSHMFILYHLYIMLYSPFKLH